MKGKEVKKHYIELFKQTQILGNKIKNLSADLKKNTNDRFKLDEVEN